jgi:hypothetical protein
VYGLVIYAFNKIGFRSFAPKCDVEGVSVSHFCFSLFQLGFSFRKIRQFVLADKSLIFLVSRVQR